MPITSYDLGIELFPHCNLNCQFCYQREYSQYKDTYTSTIQLPKSYYVNKCLEQIKKHNINGRKLFFFGGEVFYDNSASYVTSMKNLIEYLNPVEINATSNLIFNPDTSDLFQYLLNRPGLFSLCASYNPVNRYDNEKQLNLFVANVKKLYMRVHTQQTKLSIEVVLQPELLTQQVELPLLDYIKGVNTALDEPLIDVIFIVDYRGYSKEILSNFNNLLLAFLKRYPVFQNFQYLYDTSHVNKYCQRMQKGTVFLTYNNGFKYIDHPIHCIDPEADVDALNKKLEDCYHCSTCPYEKYCKDVCTAGLEKTGLLTPEQYCYHRFLFDHYTELMRAARQ